ncbi:MAG: hypothetical protein AABX53_03600 [Nanoarchaeota archaeon]
MKIQPYVAKLHASPVFKEFQQRYTDAFLVAGFFVIDFETGKNLHQIDYYVPSKKKFAAFTLDNKVVLQLLNTLDKKTPQALDMKTTIDLEALQGIIQDEMKNRSITQSIKKMIAVLQTVEGKKVWNVNCVLSGMDLLKVHVEDASETILKMEKSSLLDYIKRLPMGAQAQLGAAGQSAGAGASESAQADPQQVKPTKDLIEKKIEQLDKLKELLKKEEIELEKQEAPKKQATSAKAKKPKKK